MDQEGFSWLDICFPFQGCVGSGINGGKLYCSVIRDSSREDENIVFWGNDLFGISARAHASDNAIANLKVSHRRTALGNDAGNLSARDEWWLPPVLVFAIND